MGRVSALTAGAFTTTILVMVGGEGGPAPPSLGWVDFTIMMECTPESGNCNSVCTLWSRTADVSSPSGVEVPVFNVKIWIYRLQIFASLPFSFLHSSQKHFNLFSKKSTSNFS
jgi:hypothetical protein